MTFALPAASAEDIIRAALKDDGIVQELARELHDAAALVLPRAFASSPRLGAALSAAARILYHACTLRGGVQRTPGEEYAGVAPVFSSRGNRVYPAGRFRLMLRAILRAISHAIPIAPAWRATSSHVAAAHQALFYATGRYYSPAARFANVEYVRVDTRRDSQLPHWCYRALAAFIMAHVALEALRAVKSVIRRVRNARNRGVTLPLWKLLPCAWLNPDQLIMLEDAAKARNENQNLALTVTRTCTLCLSALTQPTITPCGHVFCWRCVVPWCVSKKICPLCRRHAPARKLVCLYQY